LGTSSYLVRQPNWEDLPIGTGYPKPSLGSHYPKCSLHVIRLLGGLISVLQLQDKGITIVTESTPKKGLTLSLDMKTIGTTSKVRRTYTLITKVPEPKIAYRTEEVRPELVHRRFAFLSYSSLQGIDNATMGLRSPIIPLDAYCSGYILAKLYL
jgi:hypothetical protein